MTHKIQIDDLVRDATAKEAAAIDADEAEAAVTAQAEAAKVSARNSALAKLKTLGLTDAEVAALVGG